jgi:hypothetical protein
VDKGIGEVMAEMPPNLCWMFGNMPSWMRKRRERSPKISVSALPLSFLLTTGHLCGH